MKKQLAAIINLPFDIKKDDGWYVATCSILDVHSQGKTMKKAKENLREALSLFLISCFERGTLDEVLKGPDVRPIHSNTKKRVDKSKFLDINVPFNNVKNLPEACHA